MKYFCPISVVRQEIENNIGDITLVFDLPYDGLCLFFEGTMFMKKIDCNVGIGIGTIGITANTHQVLTVKAQNYKLLQQHRPRRFPSCLTDWLPYAMRIPVRG